MASSYPIRRAGPADLPFFPIIERAAAELFRNSPYSWIADDDELVTDHVDLDHELAWVAVDSKGEPIAFAVVHVHSQKEIHLHELDVHPQYAHQGIGRQLIETVADWARGQGATALTLTTFDDVPWNGPYYTRLGFRTLDVNTLSPELQAVRQREAENGLPIEHRLCMQLDL